jgi:hypothetical protein
MERVILPNSIAECRLVIQELMKIIEQEGLQIEELSSKYAIWSSRLSPNSSNSNRPASSNLGFLSSFLILPLLYLTTWLRHRAVLSSYKKRRRKYLKVA